MSTLPPPPKKKRKEKTSKGFISPLCSIHIFLIKGCFMHMNHTLGVHFGWFCTNDAKEGKGRGRFTRYANKGCKIGHVIPIRGARMEGTVAERLRHWTVNGRVAGLKSLGQLELSWLFVPLRKALLYLLSASEGTLSHRSRVMHVKECHRLFEKSREAART